MEITMSGKAEKNKTGSKALGNSLSEKQTAILEFIKKEILFQNKPHLGTDVLSKIVKNMRRKIIAEGGEVIFNTRFIGFSSSGGAFPAYVGVR